MDDDTIVLIVGDQEPDIDIKEEVLDEELLNEEYLLEIEIKQEIQFDEVIIKEEITEQVEKRGRGRPRKKQQKKTEKAVKNEPVDRSYLSIEDMLEKYPEFQNDEEALVYYLSEMMINTQPPSPPPESYSYDDFVFQCSFCDTQSSTNKQAIKHYQERHGPKYCKCYGCGVEYRCMGALYKHERRCKSGYKRLLLRARLFALGDKARMSLLDDQIDQAPVEKVAERIADLPPVEQMHLSVEELMQKYPRFQRDEEALVQYLAEIMRSVEPPAPPADAYHCRGDVYQCSFCMERHSSEQNAKKHFQERHGSRYCICYGCGISYRIMGILYKHEKRCKSWYRSVVLRARTRALGGRARIDRQNLTRPAGSGGDKAKHRKQYKCLECAASFMTSGGLRAHEALHAGERAFVCDVCGAKYTSGSALSRHRGLHSGRVYECDHCGRKFPMKSGIVSHLVMHSDTKPYPCSYPGCGRGYVNRVTRDAHYNKVHLRLPPPCACSICPKRYMRTARLKEHMRSAHGMQLMTRNMFFKWLPHLTKEEVLKAKVVTRHEGPRSPSPLSSESSSSW